MWDQWEYHIEPIPAIANQEILARLNELGLERWEVCLLFPSRSHILFKRLTAGKAK